MAIDVRSIIREVAQNALQGAQSPPPQPEPKKPHLTTPRAVLLGAGLFTAGRALTGSRGREMLGSLRERVAEPHDEEYDDQDEYDEEPEAEEDEDFDDEPEAEEDEDFDDEHEYEEEPDAEGDEDYDEEDQYDEAPDAEGDEDYDEDAEEEEDEEPPRRRTSRSAGGRARSGSRGRG
jgi:hypothetical protein